MTKSYSSIELQTKKYMSINIKIIQKIKQSSKDFWILLKI
jgi:hypothetical protein